MLLLLLFLFLLRRHRVRFHNEYFDLIGYRYTSYCLYAAARRTSMYLYTPAMCFCCCSSVVCWFSVAGAAAAVRHRVPDGKICCCGSLHLIPVFFSLHSNTTYFQCTPWQFCRIYSVGFLPNTKYTYHASSVITGMRRAKAGVSPPRRSPPCVTAVLLISLWCLLLLGFQLSYLFFVYLFNEARPRERSDWNRFFPLGKKAFSYRGCVQGAII